ncbi:MAG TPA: UDP-2,3-diacylglucosamine diphosphatase LpxI [Stellaceae bacterium]|nr:UDP-2,3-diacylglucosamine diphosphatase LpxI [Stellaceae bacterium]
MAGSLGILAGAGELPFRVIEACRAAERAVFVLAFEGSADPRVTTGVPHAWVRLGAAGEGLRLLREHGVDELVMAGGVQRPSLRALRPDWRTAKFFARVSYRALGDDGLLKAIIAELEQEGFRVVGADTILGADLAPLGPLGRHRPDAEAEADIAVGLRVVHALGSLDVGQAAVVQQGLVLGVEAIEGTDALIARCATLRRDGPGGVLVKAVKPGQERRADLPTIGPLTVAGAAAAGLRGVAVEAGGALLVDRAALIEAADQAGLFVVGVAPPS